MPSSRKRKRKFFFRPAAGQCGADLGCCLYHRVCTDHAATVGITCAYNVSAPASSHREIVSPCPVGHQRRRGQLRCGRSNISQSSRAQATSLTIFLQRRGNKRFWHEDIEPRLWTQGPKTGTQDCGPSLLGGARYGSGTFWIHMCKLGV